MIFVFAFLKYFLSGGKIMSINEYKQVLLTKPVPNYSKGEEVFNWVSHLIGIVIGFVSLLIFISIGITQNLSPLVMTSLIIYSFSMMFLYAISTTYHLIDPKSHWKRIFRVIDHNTVYILIAGTYAPICAIVFPNALGLTMILIEAGCLIIGSVLNVININNKFIKIFTIILYVVMGWLVIFAWPAVTLMPYNSMMYILFGGIAYTLGVLFYGLGKKKKWMHSVFHLFVIIGTIIQLIGIIALI